MPITITQLISYPIKSCAGVEHKKTSVNTMGLMHDRQLMLIDDKGVFLSQRKHPKMALIKPSITKQCLTVNAPGMSELSINVAHKTEQTLQVNIWQDSLQADLLEQQANQWFSAFMEMPVRLVKYGEISHRAINPEYNPKNQTVAFADAFPLLITHESSLDELNQQLTVAVPMDRFRPNIVVRSDLMPWDELNWQRLSSGNCEIELVKPCGRCVMTGINQITGIQTGTEVLTTLKQKFAHQDKAVFGINGIINTDDKISAELAVGQELKLQHRSPLK